jgi:hypothetical protein
LAADGTREVVTEGFTFSSDMVQERFGDLVILGGGVEDGTTTIPPQLPLDDPGAPGDVVSIDPIDPVDPVGTTPVVENTPPTLTPATPTSDTTNPEPRPVIVASQDSASEVERLDAQNEVEDESQDGSCEGSDHLAWLATVPANATSKASMTRGANASSAPLETGNVFSQESCFF